jgi:N-acetylglucosaminyldiphosphoundecaprenol N-acetyl-beta-D-mannosaminyltransferase
MIFDKLITNPKEIIRKVLDSIEYRKPLLITYLNQHCLNIYNQNNIYKKLVDTEFDIYHADLGVFLALKFLGRKKIKRIDATALNGMILNELIKKKYPLVIVGGNFNAEFIQKEAIKKGINFVGYQGGYFSETQTPDVIDYLNNCNAQIFIIGMGVPQQEIFAEQLSRSSEFKVIICVGKFLEFYFGTKKSAPVFIKKIGLEWMFRLITEPRRLWKRYIIGIPVFFYRIVKLKFQRN